MDAFRGLIDSCIFMWEVSGRVTTGLDYYALPCIIISLQLEKRIAYLAGINVGIWS